VADQNELDRLYREAQAALKAKEYDRAAGLLTQILVIDENYKDVSRLLAQSVKLKRRRWYNHPALWSVLGFVALVGLGILIFPKISSLYTAQPAPATQVINPTTTPSPIVTVTPTQTLLPTPTPIPLTWKRISMGQDFERDTVTAFATDKKDPDVIYAAMKNAGVYKTIDGGLSWRPAHNGLASTQMESLLIDSQNSQILYAGTMGGIFKTEDGGENWYRIGDGTYLLMDLQDNSHLYARDDNGIYETTDQGKNWVTAYPLNKECPGTIRSWAIHPTDGNVLFIGSADNCGTGVYQSTNGGHSWKLIRDAGEWDNSNVLAIGVDKQGDFSVHTGCDVLTSDPDNPSVIYCATVSRLDIQQNKNAPWRAIPGTHSKVYTAIHIDHPNGIDRIIAGGIDVSHQSDPNVILTISEDGGVSWSNRDNGLAATRAELKIDPTENARIFLAMYFGGRENASCTLYRTLDGGKTWAALTSNWQYPSWCGPAFDAAHVIYLLDGGSMQKSWNGGDAWLIEHKNLGHGQETDAIENAKAYANRLPGWDRGVTYQSVSANPYLDGLLYAVGDMIYYSTNAGTIWQLSEGSETLWDARLFYTDKSKMIYAIGRYHQTYSTDSGVTWQNCGEDVTTSRSDTRLALDLQGSHLYLATPGHGVLISTDSCGSWQASNEGLSNLFVNTLAIDPNNPKTVYAGTDGGAFISFDSGQTWGQVNDGLLGATVVYSIAVDKDSNVYTATPYGVFKLESK
jgi:photosystem II stability/assembly factor-like uncharacterized protein